MMPSMIYPQGLGQNFQNLKHPGFGTMMGLRSHSSDKSKQSRQYLALMNAYA